jgi:hypothetical protein
MITKLSIIRSVDNCTVPSIERWHMLQLPRGRLGQFVHVFKRSVRSVSVTNLSYCNDRSMHAVEDVMNGRNC